MKISTNCDTRPLKVISNQRCGSDLVRHNFGVEANGIVIIFDEDGDVNFGIHCMAADYSIEAWQ